MPIVAAIPAIIGAAGAVTGGVLAGRQSGATKQALETQSQIEQYALGEAPQLINSGQGALNQALGYYSPILQGGQAATEAVGPQINSLAAQYRNSVNSLSQFAPRGGGTNQVLANEPFNLSQSITNLIQGARSNAASSITGIGENLVGSGTSLLGTGGSAASSAGSLALSQQAQTNAILNGLGTSLGTLIGNVTTNSNSGSANIGNILQQLIIGSSGQAPIISSPIPDLEPQ